MGIFGSHGEYAKLAPLFVDKFDTEPTFSKLNKAYAAGDEQANINATTALSHEQGLANVIHQKHQDLIRQVKAGEISPFKYERLAKETAHNYVNDPVRRNVETSYKANEESIKANKDKLASEGRMQQVLGYHAAVQGGSENSALTPWSAADNFSAVDFNSKIANMAAADKTVSGGITLGPAGTFQINKGSHERITREKIADYGKQILDSSPDAQAYLEQTSYGDLYNQIYAGLVNKPETAVLPDKDKKALIYQHLNTPVKRTYEYNVKDANGKVVKKKKEYMITPLQEEVERKKNQLISGVSGLASYDKYEADVNLHNIPGYGEGEDGSDEGQLPSGGATAHDKNDIATTTNPYSDLVTDIDNEQGTTSKLLEANLGVLKNLFQGVSPRYAGDLLKGRIDKLNETPTEKFNNVKNLIAGKLEEYGMDQRELAGISNTKEGKTILAAKAAELRVYENLHRNVYTQMFAPKQAEGLRKDAVDRGSTMGAVVFDAKTGRPIDEDLHKAVKRIATNLGGFDKLLDKPSSSESVNVNKLLKEANIAGISTVIGADGKGKLAYKMEIGGENLYAVIDDASMKSAYSDFNSLNELQKVPKAKTKSVVNPVVKKQFKGTPNDNMDIIKQKEGDNLVYYVRNHTTGYKSDPYTFEELAGKLNGAADKSLSNHQKRTFLYTENTKTAGE